MSSAHYVGALDEDNLDDDATNYPEGFFQDVPARDLTAADLALLTPDQLAAVIASPLYIYTP